MDGDVSTRNMVTVYCKNSFFRWDIFLYEDTYACSFYWHDEWREQRDLRDRGRVLLLVHVIDGGFIINTDHKISFDRTHNP